MKIDGEGAYYKIPMTTGSISLYFHIPFCEKKCPYCSFYNIYPKDKFIDMFLYSIKKELLTKNIDNREVVSIFFGGGTPSLLKKRDDLLYFKRYKK